MSSAEPEISVRQEFTEKMGALHLMLLLPWARPVN